MPPEWFDLTPSQQKGILLDMYADFLIESLYSDEEDLSGENYPGEFAFLDSEHERVCEGPRFASMPCG